MKSQEQRIHQNVAERIDLVPYDPLWPEQFKSEAKCLRDRFAQILTGRIEHFGSTAVPGLTAKPIIDMLIEVADLEQVKRQIVPAMTKEGYEYFWRPTFGNSTPPWYAWFIKRNSRTGKRTHHLHFVESNFSIHWERLRFRDLLRENPDVAREYQLLKRHLAIQFPNDRAAYTDGKSKFIASIMASCDTLDRGS